MSTKKNNVIEFSKDEEYNIIYKTTNYEKFKFLDWNRLIKPDHLQRVKESLEKGFHSIPILVNENLEVLDGQHRLLACKSLGIPVLYCIEPLKSSSDKIIMALNTKTKIWELRDYIEAYAKTGNFPHYEKMKKFIDKYSEFKYIRMFNWLFACSTSHISQDALKNGTATMIDEEKSEFIAMNLLKIRHEDCFTTKKLDLCKNVKLFQACFSLINNQQYSYDRFHEKSIKYTSLVYPCVSITEYKTMLYNFYNYNQPTKTKIII